MKIRITLSTLIIATIIMFSSCSSTRLISSWAGEVPTNTTNKVIVFSLIGKKANDIDLQREFESEVVARLKREGVDSYSACSAYGPSALKKMKKEELATAIAKDGYTGVLLLSLIKKDQEDNYTPPTTTYFSVPVGPIIYTPGFFPYYNCFNCYYDQVTTPGYWTTTTTYILEARLYNTLDEEDAVYIGKTGTTDPDDAVQVAKDFASTIVADMKKNGVITKK